MTPEPFRNNSALKGRERIGRDLRQASNADVSVHAAALNELRSRGITDPEPYRSLTPDAILGACRWFDAQNGRVGPGVLVAELRAGGKPGWRPTRRSSDLMAEQEAYGAGVVSWLRAHFPQWNRDDGCGTHPAAVVAVIHLHHEHGKGSLTARAHGAAIREFVARWDRRMESEPELGGSKHPDNHGIEERM